MEVSVSEMDGGSALITPTCTKSQLFIAVGLSSGSELRPAHTHTLMLEQRTQKDTAGHQWVHISVRSHLGSVLDYLPNCISFHLFLISHLSSFCFIIITSDNNN